VRRRRGNHQSQIPAGIGGLHLGRGHLGFGLLHGLGVARVLQELPTALLVVALRPHAPRRHGPKGNPVGRRLGDYNAGVRVSPSMIITSSQRPQAFTGFTVGHDQRLTKTARWVWANLA